MAQRFLSIEDLLNSKAPAWLIDGLFEANSLTMIAGPAGSYKSFLVLDMQLSMAAGRKWCNRSTIPSKVLYVLGEGKASLLRRIQTWSHFNRVTPEESARLFENFRISFEVPQLASKASVDNMLAGLEAEQYHPNVIVIDTFARSFVGLDENSQKDVGMWVEQADRLRQIGYTVIFLHHTAKNTEFGVKYRGSTAIMGAMDTAMTMVRDSPTSDRVTVTVSKQKDHDEGSPLHFQRLQVVAPGQTESSIVLVPAVQVDERFTDEYKAVEEAVKDLIATPFDSDTARARDLARQFGMTEAAAKMRISRHKKGQGLVDKVEHENVGVTTV